MQYTCSVAEKSITKLSRQELVRGNIGIDTIKATFDGEWERMEHILCVFTNGGMAKRIELVDGECEIPWEVYGKSGDTVYLTFVGYDDDDEADRIVTRKMAAPLIVVERGNIDACEPSDPTPDVYGEILDGVKTVDEILEGGTEGQVLTKTADGTGWADPAPGGVSWDDLVAVNNQIGIAQPLTDESGNVLVDEEGRILFASSLDDYVTEDELPAIPTNVSAFTNDAGYLTEHQDLSGYALKSELPTVPTNVSAFTNDSGYLTAVPAEYVTETELASYGYQTAAQVSEIVDTALGVIENGSY